MSIKTKYLFKTTQNKNITNCITLKTAIYSHTNKKRVQLFAITLNTSIILGFSDIFLTEYHKMNTIERFWNSEFWTQIELLEPTIQKKVFQEEEQEENE